MDVELVVDVWELLPDAWRGRDQQLRDAVAHELRHPVEQVSCDLIELEAYDPLEDDANELPVLGIALRDHDPRDLHLYRAIIGVGLTSLSDRADAHRLCRRVGGVAARVLPGDVGQVYVDSIDGESVEGIEADEFDKPTDP